jgi:hypothetical protein
MVASQTRVGAVPAGGDSISGARVWAAGATVEERPFQGRVRSHNRLRALAPVVVFLTPPNHSQFGGNFFRRVMDITNNSILAILRSDHE